MFRIGLGLLVEQCFHFSLHEGHFACARRPQDSRTASIFARLSGEGGVMGNRHTGSSKPIMAIAAFTGIGFDSTKLISISGNHSRCSARAPAKSPVMASLVSIVISAGI